MNAIPGRVPIVGVVVLMLASAPSSATAAGDEDKLRHELDRFVQVLALIRQNYVHVPDDHALMDGAINGMLRMLNPHSVYWSKAQQDSAANSDVGVGLSVEVRDGSVIIIGVDEGTPASRLGLQPGDRILEIDRRTVPSSETVQDVMLRLTGREGSTVRLTVERDGRFEPMRLEVTREPVRTESVPYAYMIRPGIGYVRIGRFAQTTSDAFDQAIGRLEGEGMKSLVLDLRANSGGLLSQAVDVLDRLVPKGKLLVSTRGRIAAAQAEYRSTGRKKFEGPIIVLIDHASASAAEVVAGGLQDLDRALVVGTASFGNGTVQNQIRLLDGASLRLTIATIYTPSGRPIQRDGEYYAGDSEALSSARTAGSTFNTVSGRTVHDGGIQPDVVVDVRELTPIELEMIEKHAFRDFAIHHVRGHPARTAPSGSLGPGFQLTDAEWAELRHAAEARGVIVSDSTWTAERDFILRQTRMELAVARGSSLEGYKISTETDHQLQSALDLFPRAADLQLRSGAKPSGAGR